MRFRVAYIQMGYNIGMNLGRISGTGIDQHVYICTWNGDTNLMPLAGDTKVISQSLQDAYSALAPFFSTEGAISTDLPSGA